MKATPIDPGRVVISRQGHDAGRWYAIVRVLEDGFVLLCDGETRKLAKPKKKQGKHLRALPLTVAVEGRGESGGAIADSDIRKALRAQKDAYLNQTGFRANQKEEGALVEE